MDRFKALALSGLLTATAAVAQSLPPELQPTHDQSDDRVISLERIVSGVPLPLRESGDPLHRPRLNVSLDPGRLMRAPDTSSRPSISLSLEAWEMNTASLAHIQCSRAVRSIERTLVENCRFVDGPLPQESTNLVQFSGQWLATRSLALGAGVYTGHKPVPDYFISATQIGASASLAGTRDRVDGFNVNLSFGMELGSIGDLLLDLQIDRYRQRPQAFAPWYSSEADGAMAALPSWLGTATSENFSDSRMSGELGIGWRGRNFGADLTGQYRELPYWFGDDLRGESFRSFDIEFSWRAPSRSSISVGVSNVLNNLPGQGVRGGEQALDTAVDGVYGRIPYVRYKHDL